jgi:hypothetical protein
MTRSEEELRVGTTQRERGRVRLRKYVITEHVERVVPVRRERVRLDKETVTGEERVPSSSARNGSTSTTRTPRAGGASVGDVGRRSFQQPDPWSSVQEASPWPPSGVWR